MKLRKSNYFYFENEKSKIQRGVKKIKTYWNTMMINFLGNVYWTEREYVFTQLDYWYSNGNLELEDMFFEMKSNYSSKQNLEKDRRSFIYDN